MAFGPQPQGLLMEHAERETPDGFVLRGTPRPYGAKLPKAALFLNLL